MAGTSWKNVSGEYSIEVWTDGLRCYDIDDKALPMLNSLCFANGFTYGELVIDFLSSGYDDPGSMYGGSDNLGYPPEGDDEREPESAYLKDEDGNEIDLTPQQRDALFDLYSDQIQDVELCCD
jgi:hypothetical protein